jgi:hypothetical protein
MVMATVVPITRAKYPWSETLYNEMTEMVNRILASRDTLDKAFMIYLSDLFSLRMNISYHLLQEDIDWKSALAEMKVIVLKVKEMIGETGNILLADNFGFAANVVADVTGSMLETYNLDIVKGAQEMVCKMTLKDVEASLQLQAIPLVLRENVIEITRTATFLEFAIYLVLLYSEREVEIPKEKLEELPFRLRDWAQLYGALAQELQISNVVREPQQEIKFRLQKDEIREEQELAEMGLEDYLEGILKNEHNN